jgi:tRNA pseudouridine38-40 synthase
LPDVLLKLVIAYDGTGFHGWARQPQKRTVEAVLREAFGELYGGCTSMGVGGRTDTGVHALANVASVGADGGPPVERAVEALNGVLPLDVAILSAEEAPEGFHARFSARTRTYRYRVWRRRERSPFEVDRSLFHPRPLDVDGLNAAAALIVGQHDFRAFTPADTEHDSFLRVVERAEWIDRGDTVDFEITADSFLRHMVRTLVGTMLERGSEGLDELLAGADRSAAGSTAPPHGLYLVGLSYR